MAQQVIEVDILNNAGLQALVGRPEPKLHINLKRLEALSTATDSYGLLRRLVIPTNWTCEHLRTLEQLCGLSAQLSDTRDIFFDVAAVVPPDTLALDANNHAAPQPQFEAQALEVFSEMKKMGYDLKKLTIPGIKANSDLVRLAKVFGSKLELAANDVLNGGQHLQVFQNNIAGMNETIDLILGSSMQFR